MMFVLAGLGGVMLLLLIWSAHDLGRRTEHRPSIAVLVGIAVPALLALAALGAMAGSLAAAALSLLAAIAVPVSLSGRRPRRGLHLVASPPAGATGPVAATERRAA